MSQRKIYNALFNQMDISGLAIVRMLFGLIMMLESYRYTDLNKLVGKYTATNFNFKFRFFEWVEPLSTQGMTIVYFLYGVAGFLIFLGLFYRLAILLGLFSISFLFFSEATNYLNHIYLVIIFTAMMFFIPSHKGWSLYAYFNPSKAKDTAPGWAYWLIRSQLFLVYFFAAVAKMNADWLNGMPLFDWIGGQAPSTGFESYMKTTAFVYFFTYAGLFYDLFIPFLLVYRKTRAFAFCISLSFHMTNFYLFNIGIFPWFMVAATTIFFEPNWPRDFLSFFLPNKFLPVRVSVANYESYNNLNSYKKIGLYAIYAHFAVQIILPLRHFAYPNYASWTEDGHNFAWHMKLRGKKGKAIFTVRDPDTKKEIVVDNLKHITLRQDQKMATRPDLILQFAQYLGKLYTPKGEKTAEVYVETSIKVNNRKAQRLIDPDVNLMTVKDSLWLNDWILPLRQPVWNTAGKKNRLGPSFKKDIYAIKALPKYDEERISLGKNN